MGKNKKKSKNNKNLKNKKNVNGINTPEGNVSSFRKDMVCKVAGVTIKPEFSQAELDFIRIASSHPLELADFMGLNLKHLNNMINIWF